MLKISVSSPTPTIPTTPFSEFNPYSSTTMQAYKFQGTIDPSGHLVIHDPIAMPPGDVEVIMWPSETSIRSNSGEFLPGEFAQLFHSALETINLTLHAGVNWTAFAHSINRINADYKTAQLGIQSIENKGDGIILLKLSTAPGSDTVQIHRDFMRIYEETKQMLENRRQLNARDTLLGHTTVDSIHPRESINQLFELLSPQLTTNSSFRVESHRSSSIEANIPSERASLAQKTKRVVECDIPILKEWLEKTEPAPPDFDADQAKWEYLKEKHNL
jgi:hypothetical protein